MMYLSEVIITRLLLPLCVSAVTAIAGYLFGMLKSHKGEREKHEAHDKLMEAGMKAVLRRDIVDMYEDYVEQGRTLTIERKQELDTEFETYAALGGNGTGRQMYEEICKKCKVEVVR